jgi:hypothetical protein
LIGRGEHDDASEVRKGVRLEVSSQHDAAHGVGDEVDARRSGDFWEERGEEILGERLDLCRT